jgi:hypothetical protein
MVNNITQIKTMLRAMSWPQFYDIIRQLGIDVGQFYSGSSPSQRIVDLEQQLTVQGLNWGHVNQYLTNPIPGDFTPPRIVLPHEEGMIDTLQMLLEKFSYPAYYFPLAYRLALEGHSEDRRKNGVPYINHVGHVIVNSWEIIQADPYLAHNMVAADEILSLSACHDLFEDHPEAYSLDTIRRRLTTPGVTKHSDLNIIISGIDAISKKAKGTEEYADYVNRVARHAWARISKRADLKHNMGDLTPGSLRDKYSLTKFVLENMR